MGMKGVYSVVVTYPLYNFLVAGTKPRGNIIFIIFFFDLSEGKAIGDDQYDVEKELFIKTQRRKGVGRVGEGIEVTAIGDSV